MGIEIGQTVGGCQVIALLGRGGMGKVHGPAAHALLLNRRSMRNCGDLRFAQDDRQGGYLRTAQASPSGCLPAEMRPLISRLFRSTTAT